MRPARLVLAGIVLLFLSSCFDPPVREELRLRFLPNGAVVATSTAIEESLKPAPLYRASWRVNPQDESEFHWEEEKAP
jgi:hypothetical protein